MKRELTKNQKESVKEIKDSIEQLINSIELYEHDNLKTKTIYHNVKNVLSKLDVEFYDLFFPSDRIEYDFNENLLNKE